MTSQSKRTVADDVMDAVEKAREGKMNAREAQMLSALKESNDALARCLNGTPLLDYELSDFIGLMHKHWKLMTKLEARKAEDARFKGND